MYSFGLENILFLACTVKVCCLVVVRQKNHRGSEHLWLRGWQCEKCGGEPPGRNTHTHIQAVCSHLQWLCLQYIDWWMKLLFFQCYNDQSIRMMAFVLSCYNCSLWTIYIYPVLSLICMHNALTIISFWKKSNPFAFLSLFSLNAISSSHDKSASSHSSAWRLQCWDS